MPITSTFNTMRYMMQLMRHQNMANENGSQPRTENIKKAQVEIANIKEYADESYNVSNVIAAIQSGRGRIQSNELPIVEDGGILPADVTPSRQIKDLKPIMDYQVNAASNTSINELRIKQLEDAQKRADVEEVVSDQEEPRLTGPPEVETNTVQAEHAVEEYQKQLTAQKQLAAVPAPTVPEPQAEPNVESAAPVETSRVQSVGNTIDIMA